MSKEKTPSMLGELHAVVKAPTAVTKEYEQLTSAIHRYKTFASLFITEEAPVIALNPEPSEITNYVHHCLEAKRKAFAALTKEQQDLIAPFVAEYISTEWEEELIAAIQTPS